MNESSPQSAPKDKGSEAADAKASSKANSRNSIETVPKAKRRTFTAEYKARVLREAGSVADIRGGVGELLRREGLYSSHLTEWRREAEDGARKGLSKKRGCKPRRTPESREIEQLRRDKARLEERLRKAEIVIEVQKKVSTLLGLPLLPDPREEP